MVHKTNQRGELFDATPRGVLEALVIGGGIAAALAAGPTVFAVLAGAGFVFSADEKIVRRKVKSSVQYLRRRKYITLVKNKDGMRISATRKGEAIIKAHLARRDLLKPIERPARWDGKWRLVLFDIASDERTKRNAFRSMVRRLGAVMVQKSVWVHPFDCSEQIDLLRDAFTFSEKELRLVVADSIGDDRKYRMHFGI